MFREIEGYRDFRDGLVNGRSFNRLEQQARRQFGDINRRRCNLEAGFSHADAEPKRHEIGIVWTSLPQWRGEIGGRSSKIERVRKCRAEVVSLHFTQVSQVPFDLIDSRGVCRLNTITLLLPPP